MDISTWSQKSIIRRLDCIYLTAVGRLAVNDVNKSLLGEEGAIDILVDIASLDDSHHEQIGESRFCEIWNDCSQNYVLFLLVSCAIFISLLKKSYVKSGRLLKMGEELF